MAIDPQDTQRRINIEEFLIKIIMGTYKDPVPTIDNRLEAARIYLEHKARNK